MMETATALATNPKWRSRILDKPELWGLESISNDALVIRIVLKTRTTAKDDVSRELRARLKSAVDELGVKLPSLNTIVLTGFDGAASVSGAKPPRTRPTQAVEQPVLKGRKARAAAKRAPVVTTDPRSVRLRPQAEKPQEQKPQAEKPQEQKPDAGPRSDAPMTKPNEE